MIIYTAGISSLLKLLLIPAYRSTDFEVHRNWLAITKNLPLHQWYQDETSPWTLDYPPLFAWFQYLLAQFAGFFDSNMLKVENLNYASGATIAFMRLTVIFSDATLIYGTQECCTYLSQSGVKKSSKWSSKWRSPSTILQVLLLFNVGLFMVDHIHFQYNGLLLGILLISIARILKRQELSAAIWFAILLNMKHIFLYLAPVYFVYLLRNYTFQAATPGFKVQLKSFSPNRFAYLGLAVAIIFFISFGPFIFLGQLQQIIARLFPFGRGLTHAYWAPNFWALYNICDKILEVIIKSLHLNIPLRNSTVTSGLAENTQHAVLPPVPPSATFTLTILFIIPCLLKLWRCPGNPLHFIRALVICGLTSFLFGWHVHEKAILLPIIPLAVLTVLWMKEAKVFIILSAVGYVSLLPLLPTGLETPLKLILIAFHLAYIFNAFKFLFDESKLVTTYEKIYLYGLIILAFSEIILPSVFPNFPFLPLLLISVYCSVGVCYCWANYYYYFVTYSERKHKRKTH